MADVYYPGIAAGDAASIGTDGVVSAVVTPNANYQVFELSDSTFSTPLTIRTPSGLTDTKVPVGALPVFPDVYVVSPNFAHNWKSGALVFRRDSADAKDKAVAEALAAAQLLAAETPQRVSAEVERVAATGAFKGEPGKDGANVATTREAVASELGDPNSPGRAVLSATIADATEGKLDESKAVATLAPAAAARPGNRVVFLGDSITKGADERDIVYRQTAWPVYASITSGQRVHYIRNAGYPGETSTQILARFDGGVTPFAPNLVTVAVGTNDLSGTGGTATARANIRTIVGKIRAIGAVPVLCTLAPGVSGAPATRRAETIQLNAWIRDYASRQGLTVLDFYGVLTDPANGNFLPAYSSGDGIHPNATGYAAMGRYAATVLAPLLPDWRPFLPQDNADPNNLLGNGLFLTDADANGIPDGWSNQAGVTGQTISLVAGDTGIKGNWVRYVLAGSSGTSILFRSVTGATIVPGNRYLFTGRVKASGMSGGAGPKALLRWTATANRDDVPLQALPYDIDSGIFHCEIVAPAGATTAQIQFSSTAGTGTYQFAQVGLYNLTAMGVSV